MKTCQICGKEETLPFRCKFCNGIFCYEHRLPENHNCTGLSQVKEYLGEKIVYEPSKLEVKSEKHPKKIGIKIKFEIWYILLILILILSILRILGFI